jgi:protein-S-isoprenylcysteine O-methyltransferase Ste14
MLKVFVPSGILIAAILVWMWTVFAAHAPSTSADYASWAHAFGTVAAVFVALVIPFAKHLLGERVRQSQERRAHGKKLEAAYQLGVGPAPCGRKF